ncbi:MAG: carbamoyl-phosphate synthase large subunit [Deltaproteobacteria bacterium]|uniref:Carbamoyl phosphate synthase large chain n=1 Tax=Candidatus Zymogenus saltonus TaxID=2844893 RepID=A0A9D8PJT7_9DELT|nr:carbamoyl-phosphate synthase large subunit [Candidatus Zymogenus saltonus]
MPKRTDIKKILIIGSGPIIIGQACEFDYSGTQAVKALKEEGYEVVLVNSNPATIMTDPEFAHATYIEPITPVVVEKIIKVERPDCLLPTLGGQTGLNIAVDLHRMGVLDKYSVELIGAKFDAIEKAEDRELFKAAMKRIGLNLPESGYARTLDEAKEVLTKVGFPNIIRPSYTLGGTGGNIVYNLEEFEGFVRWGIDQSPIGQVLIEESVLGWKEFELEVMRDTADNVVIICSIENFDPMGIHTGDSITVAPAQTLTDKEYQIMRNASIAIIREIGVDTGGSNIQFAVNPVDGRLVVIEMNPRVSRSSALASKATGFPIAKIAAKLAVGLTLDEIRNDITKETPASFEPTIDYVVTKIPRFTFEKFPQSEPYLTTQMKSVGEVMAIGRTFRESIQKALNSLETGYTGFNDPLTEEERKLTKKERKDLILRKLGNPSSDRVLLIAEAFRQNISVEKVHEVTKIDPWFLTNISQIVEMEDELLDLSDHIDELDRENFKNILLEAKEYGFSDLRLSELTGIDQIEIRRIRMDHGVASVFKRVDTCAAEFEAYTPYLYSTYETECEAKPTDKKKIMILGGGPNRIGQGIEFDYCCVHGSFALAEAGFETIMVNCNPETVSTDYDTSDRLYFEPLTFENVLNIVDTERPDGVIVQFGGQTPLKLAVPLERAGVPIIGTSPDSIDRAEDRERFQELLNKLKLKQPDNGIARSVGESIEIANKIGYPVLVRPSYVLGGRAMEIVQDEEDLRNYMRLAVMASPEHPVLIDKFLSDALELDVDAVSDGEEVFIGGVMEHIEEAGVHSGDSGMSLPTYSVKENVVKEIKKQTKKLALELQVVGLMNVQFAVKNGEIYIIEVNPRASRTVPFVSKAIGIPMAKIAARVMAGEKLNTFNLPKEVIPKHMSVKESVFPFAKFPGVDTLLGPEMKSTGEVMGIDTNFARAFYKAQLACGLELPLKGNVFISVKDSDKDNVLDVAKKFSDLGFGIIATTGTHRFLVENKIKTEFVYKLKEKMRPDVVDKIKSNEIQMVINTTTGKQSIKDSSYIRRNSLLANIPVFTTIPGARAAVEGIEKIIKGDIEVKSIQEYHKGLKRV